MKIIITHFKCYYNTHVFDFPAYKLSLLSSPSGSGKTTIFTAIMWCLYGSISKIKPNKSNSTKDTSVAIEFPESNNLKITRTSSKIEVSLSNGNLLTSDAAQGYIENFFGHKTLWISSSYMSQEDSNPLLILANNDKFKLLYELTYGCEADIEINNPDYYIDKCDKQLAQLKTTTNIETGRFNSMKDVYVQYYNSNIDIVNLWPKNINIDQLENFILEKQKIQNQNIDLNKKLLIIRDIESKITTLNTTIQSLTDKLLCISYRSIHEIQKELDSYEIYKNQFQKIDLINSLKNRLNEFPNIPENYTERLSQAQEELNSVLNFQKFCSEEGIKSLKDEIIKYEKEIELIDVYENWKTDIESWRKEYNEKSKIIEETWLEECNIAQNKYNEYLEKKRKKDYNNKLIEEYNRNKEIYDKERKSNDIIKEEYEKIHSNYNIYVEWWKTTFNTELNISNIESKLQEFNMLLKELICPHCNKGVTYSNNNLNKGHSDDNTRELAKSQIANIQNIYEIYKFHDQSFKKYSNIKELIEPIYPVLEFIDDFLEQKNLILPTKQRIEIRSEPKEPQKPSLNCKSKYEKLKSIIEPPYVLKNLQNEIELLKKGYEYTKIKTQLESLGVVEIPIDVNEIMNKIQDLQKELLLSRQKETEKNSILNSINDLQNSLPNKPEKSSEIINNEIIENNNKINEYEMYIKAGNLINKLNADRVNVETMHKYLIELSNYTNNVEKIKQIINEVSSSSLEDTVKNIAATTNIILKEIYEDDIAVVLNTHKELKNGKNKLQVHLQIYYQNTVYDSPSELSCGEKDRISIALTLAISKISNSPLIILDESLKFVDENIKEKCLDYIKTNFTNKTVIHVSHECIKGIHHEVLSIK